MRRLCLLTLQLVALICLASDYCRAQAPPDAEIVAIIVRIQGKVYWKKSRQSPDPPPLNVAREVGKPLLFGDWVKIEPGSILNVSCIKDNKLTNVSMTTAPKQAAVWRTFVHQQTGEQAALWHALTNYSVLGGRNRGPSTMVISPAPTSVVRPRSLVFRWNPTKYDVKLRISLSVTGETESGSPISIWTQEGISGKDGFLDSQAARAALTALSARRGNPILLISDDRSIAESTSFTLMDPGDERTMEQQLKEMNSLPELLLHTGRAYVLSAFKLLNEAADEYEIALKASPRSTPLLLAAIAAQEQIGNRERAKELRAQLPPGTKVPGDD